MNNQSPRRPCEWCGEKTSVRFPRTTQCPKGIYELHVCRLCADAPNTEYKKRDKYRRNNDTDRRRQ